MMRAFIMTIIMMTPIILAEIVLSDSLALQYIPPKSDSYNVKYYINRALKSDGLEKFRAVTALYQIADPLSVPTLIKLLDSDDLDVVNMSVMALSAIGDPATADHLFNVINNNYSVATNMYARNAIIKMTNIPYHVIHSHITNGSIDVRLAAVASLGYCKDSKSAKMIEKYLSHGNPLFQISAITAFINKYRIEPSAFSHTSYTCGTINGEQDDKPAIPNVLINRLYKLINSPNRDVRYYAARAVSLLPIVPEYAVYLKLSNDSDSRIRSLAVKSLSRYKQGSVTDKLIEALYDGDYDVEDNAAYSLGVIGSKEAVSSLTKKIEKNVDDNNSAAIEALGKHESQKVHEVLKKSLKSKSYNSRCSAAMSLGKYHKEYAYGILYNQLVKIGDVSSISKDAHYKKCLTKAIILTNNPESILYFREQLNKNPNTIMHIYAIKALFNILGEVNINKLDIISIKERDTALSALDVLMKMNGNNVINKISEALDYKDHAVRSKAASILGDKRSTYAVDPLINAYNDNYYNVKCAVHKALIKIAGSEYGHDKESWRKWWEESKHKYESLECTSTVCTSTVISRTL
ncbi:MAG: HEAT repeat domain-containing protein [Nitrospinota bacterium]|nr:HEAT repeat domain-containing protein [Nitrospinota bacterium]